MDISFHQKKTIRTWGEEDAYTSWRHLYCHLSRPGVVKKIKKATHRRDRREAKQLIREDLDS